MRKGSEFPSSSAQVSPTGPLHPLALVGRRWWEAGGEEACHEGLAVPARGGKCFVLRCLTLACWTRAQKDWSGVAKGGWPHSAVAPKS